MDGSAPTAEDLLAHTDWLTQLARALVGDATAGDVVQQTYEVALKQPPKESGPLRPWLGGVARNIARMTARGRRRRERREEEVEAIGPVEVPTPEDLVARAEMQQQVARIVLELGEPLRQTLLLRFFEGMTAAEIARAQGIPAATVRSRLKDALDRVRATLDRRHGGDRRRWAVLLAPLPIAAGTSGAAATLVGGLLVKTSVKLLIAVVVLIAIAIGTRLGGLWGQAGDAPAVAGSAGSAVAKPAMEAPARLVSPGAAQLELAVYEDDPRGTLRLEGQVIDERDQPVVGAVVAIDANPPLVVETDDGGSFVFEGLVARDYRIEATKAEGYAGPARLRLVDKGEPITLRMRRGGALDVLVVERPGGKPVAGAEVELRSTLTWRATSGPDGVAQLRGVGAAWAPLAVRAASFSPAAMIVDTSGNPAAPQRVTIGLSRGAEVAGRVLDEAGKPIAGARVVPTQASEPMPVVDARRDGVITGADGAFSFPALAAGSWRITASHGDRAPSTSAPIPVDGVSPRKGVELVLGAGGAVRGVVRDGAGKAIAGADVSAVVRGHVWWRARRQAFTGADGRFAITGLPRRALDVVAWHDTGASAIAPVDLAATRESEVALTLDVTGAIEGIVVDRAGAPVPDAQVAAGPEWTGGVADRAVWSVRGVQQTVTNQAGRFRFGGLPPGSYRMRAARPGAVESALSLSSGVLVKPGDPPITLSLAGDGRVVGKVAFADGTAPVAFTVAVGSTHPVPFLAKDGAFSIPTVAGTHGVIVEGPGFVPRRLGEVAVADGKDTDVGTITVAKGRSISGRVLDERGAPVAGAKVAAGSLLTGGGAELYMESESIGAKSTETDDSGRFTLDGFPPTSITVLAGKDGIGRSQSARIPAGPDSATLDLVLAATTGLTGTITRNGAPVPDTIVIASPIGSMSSNFFVQTGPDGVYVLDALAPDSYVVYPMLGEGGGRPKDMYVRRVEVTLGARARGDVDATPGPVKLSISVKTDKGAPVPMAQILAMRTLIDAKTMGDLRDGSRLPAVGDEVIPTYIRRATGGASEIEGMRPGAHTICAVPITAAMSDPETIKTQCVQPKLDATPQQKVEIVIPASWLEPPK